MVARRVRCRGGAVRSPEPSSVKRSPSRAAICSADSTVTRAAASSMASGTPSRARQMAATAIAFRSVIAKPGRAAAARSANSWAASKPASSAAPRRASGGGTASGATCHTDSCGIRSGSWLVARMRSPGQLASSRWQTCGAGVDQVLAVVQHDQRLPRLQRVSQRVLQRAPGLAVHPDQGGHPGHDQVRLPQVAQFDRVHPVARSPRPWWPAAAGPAGSSRSRPRRTG